MKILITRPQDRVQPLQLCLEDKGYACVSYPLLEITPVEFEPFDVQRYDGIIITSLYAAPHVPFCNKEIFVVGDVLKKTFPASYVFPNIKDLKLALNPESCYLYLRGEYVTDDLCDVCHDARTVYTTKAVNSLPPDFDGVLLFSKRTAEIFENLSKDTKDLEVFVFSIEIAHSLKKKYKKIHIAPKSTLEDMLNLF